jgi:hypothetical protein
MGDGALACCNAILTRLIERRVGKRIEEQLITKNQEQGLQERHQQAMVLPTLAPFLSVAPEREAKFWLARLTDRPEDEAVDFLLAQRRDSDRLLWRIFHGNCRPSVKRRLQDALKRAVIE